MRTTRPLAPHRAWLLAACIAAACTREQPRSADTTVAALPAARACLAADTVLAYDNQKGGENGEDPSGERIIFRRAGGRWSGIARNQYTPEDSVIDSLTISPATGAIRFILWPRSRGPVEFRGTIECDSITGARRSIRASRPPIEDVYRNVRWLERHDAQAITTLADTVTLASGLVDTAVADTGLRLDAAGRPIVPIVWANRCEGEDCPTSFPAVACATAVLRARPDLAAPFIARVRPDDTLHVDRVDLHVVKPGIVVVRRPLVLDTDHDMDSNEPRARNDTLRFAAGDTVYLTRYEQLGWWSYVWRGRERTTEEFWGTPPGADELAMGVVSSDTSRAVARSQPTHEYWWLVRRGNDLLGWWLRDESHALRSIAERNPDAPCSYHYER